MCVCVHGNRAVVCEVKQHEALVSGRSGRLQHCHCVGFVWCNVLALVSVSKQTSFSKCKATAEWFECKTVRHLIRQQT